MPSSLLHRADLTCAVNVQPQSSFNRVFTSGGARGVTHGGGRAGCSLGGMLLTVFPFSFFNFLKGVARRHGDNGAAPLAFHPPTLPQRLLRRLCFVLLCVSSHSHRSTPTVAPPAAAAATAAGAAGAAAAAAADRCGRFGAVIAPGATVASTPSASASFVSDAPVQRGAAAGSGPSAAANNTSGVAKAGLGGLASSASFALPPVASVR